MITNLQLCYCIVHCHVTSKLNHESHVGWEMNDHKPRIVTSEGKLKGSNLDGILQRILDR